MIRGAFGGSWRYGAVDRACRRGANGHRVLDPEAMDLSGQDSNDENGWRPSPHVRDRSRPPARPADAVRPTPITQNQAVDGTHRGAERSQSPPRLRRGSADRRLARPGAPADWGSDADRRRHQRRAERAEASPGRRCAGNYQIDRGHDCARGRRTRSSGETAPRTPLSRVVPNGGGASPTARSSMQLNSESQLDAKLHLPRVEHIARRAEPDLCRRWRIRVVDAAPHRVDVLDVLPVEQVEHVEREVEARAVVH